MNTGVQNFSDLAVWGTFLNWGSNEGGVENSMENWPYLGKK